MSKILLILIVSGCLMVASAVLGYLNKAKLADRQTALSSAETAKATALADSSRAKDLQKKAEAAKADAEAKASQLQNDLTSAQGKVSTIQEQANTAQKNFDDAQAKVNDLTQQVAKLSSAPTPPPVTPEMAKQLDDAKHQLAELQVVKDSLQEKLTAAQAQTASLQRQAAARASGEAMNGLRGRVLAVDRNWNFVVLDLGGRNGVNNNSIMVVLRGGSMVGRVRITSVEPSQSIADIVPNSVPAGVSVEPGDSVVFPGS